MEFLRLKSLIHRDIKPQNILLSSTSETELPILKIGDFGFARALPIASMADTLCGSPLYMAPEILKGEKYDAKSDLWSLGTVFYEMVSSKPPFRANNHIELLKKIEARDGPKWSNVQVSEPIKDLISRLLKKNPLERMAFEEFFLHPCVKGLEVNHVQTLPRRASEHERKSVSVLEGDSPFPGYGVDSKIFQALKSSKNEKYDFVHIQPVSASVKWVDEKPLVAASLLLPCPWRGESIIDVFSLSRSDEGMIMIFGLRISCLDSLIFSEFIPSADSPYEWSIVLDLCLLSLDLYQTCLDYCRSYFKSHKSISRDLKELCSWIVCRTCALIKEAEHASSLIADEVDWDPPLILQCVFDKISSSLNSKPPSSVMIISCLVNLVLCDGYCKSIVARHSLEFMSTLHKELADLKDVAK
jgi:serine/threonine protein kinase